MLPMRDKAEFEAQTFSSEDVENLFNNIEILAIISQQFLQSLEQRFASTDNFTCFGDIILKYISLFFSFFFSFFYSWSAEARVSTPGRFQMVLPLYSVYYRKYEETNELLLRLGESSEFTQLIEVRDPLALGLPATRGLTMLPSQELQSTSTYNPMLALKVYLYRPCQRIPQYSLLLKQLLSYTPGS
jgi:hypothetical protein